MSERRLMIPGVVQNGIVVPQGEATLPEGAHVEIVLGPPEVSPELKAEFGRWEQASDEAWSRIDEWEKDEP